MEKRIEARKYGSLVQVVNALLACEENGEHAYCWFNGHKLHSEGLTMDSAFIEVTGYTREQLRNGENKLEKIIIMEREECEKREASYAERVKKSREESMKLFNGKVIISYNSVINGLKFIAENKSISHYDLVDSLLDLGCIFTLDDIREHFPTRYNFFEGMNVGYIAAGATIIANVRDSEFGRSYVNNRFLSEDDDTSIYHFIRVATGDEWYTKEYVDSLGDGPTRKKSK